MHIDRVVLVGQMGAGKTTVGKALSASFGLPLIDIDLMLARRHNLSIKQIFSYMGEDYFRQVEAQLISEVIRMPKVVVATGGGCIEDKNTRDNLSKCGTVVYLQVSLSIQKQRLRCATDRPLLNKVDRLKYRDKLYASIADLEIDTDYLTVSEIVEDVYNFCRKSA